MIYIHIYISTEYEQIKVDENATSQYYIENNSKTIRPPKKLQNFKAYCQQISNIWDQSD